jgi:hypothetical protein
MKYEEGISAEMLSKKLGISPLIVKIKLKVIKSSNNN